MLLLRRPLLNRIVTARSPCVSLLCLQMFGMDPLAEMRFDHAHEPVCSRGITSSCWQAAAVHLLSASDVLLRVALATTVLVSTSAYCWSVASATKPGLQRLLTTLPALVAIHLVPLMFDQPSILRVSATFLAVRLTSGKVRHWFASLASAAYRCVQCTVVSSTPSRYFP